MSGETNFANDGRFASMCSRAFLRDESGAVTSDWVVLTAGILLMGSVLVISVMENSSGYLMDEMEVLNEQYAQDAVTVSALDSSATDSAPNRDFEDPD